MSCDETPQQPAAIPPAPPPLLNCPKCRTPLGPDIELCCSCGVKVKQMASVDRPPVVDHLA
ncbi:MAG: hypothetical protein ACYC63_20460 [Armatimonadota bacterium]